MTREETIERIKVMQAYINGEKVQYKKNLHPGTIKKLIGKYWKKI